VDAFKSIVARTPRLGRPVLIAVDGVDGSGKTTFAAHLAEALARVGRSALVVHEDDFLNPRAVRHRLGLDSPEGFFLHSYDLQALGSKVLDPVARGAGVRIVPAIFDFRTDTTVDTEPVDVPPDAVVIVEGMFLHRDELADRWDLSVFLDVPFAETARRMAERDGSNPDPEHPSMRRYIQGQRHYLSVCRPQRRATFVIDNSDPHAPRITLENQLGAT
jgi:uridine kinase